MDSEMEKYIKQYDSENLYKFSQWYRLYHGYISVGVCIFGIICNIFNIVVLTRKNMISSFNIILTGLAVADMLTMTSYTVFALHFYCLSGHIQNPTRDSYGWATFMLFHSHFSVTTHTIAIFLAVLLAIFRYAFVRLAMPGTTIWNNPSVAIFSVGIVYLGSTILMVPNYISLYVANRTKIQNNTTLSYYEVANIDHWITEFNFWIHALLVKMVPCVLLTIFCILLVINLKNSQKRRQKLLASQRNESSRERMRDHSRTTQMLLVVLFLFLFTELPQGVLTLLSGVKKGFFEAIYLPMGDVFDIIALINNAINFILYCSMSKQFRDTFVKTFCFTRDSNKKTETKTTQEVTLSKRLINNQ